MLALDQSNGHMVVFANNQAGGAHEYDSSGSCVSEFGTFSTSPSATALKAAVDSSCALHDPPLTEQTTPTCESLHPSNGNAYVASDGSNNEVQPFDVNAFGALEYPEGEEEPEEFKLTVAKTGTGTGKVTGPGIDCGSDCDEEYEEGTEVTLEAIADPGSEFTGWSGSGCSGTGTCKVTMSEAREVAATFEEEDEEGIPLTVALEGTGSGTVTSDKGAISCNPFCTDDYEEGTVVVLTATPNPGSVFVSWKYCDKGGVNGRQCTMTVDKAKTVKATFTTTHALEVSRSGSGLGKVQSSPGGILCLSNCSETTAAFKEGTVVTLKQTPAKHFHFVEWLGDCSGSGACATTMGEDHEVEANSSAYYQGEVVELTVTPGKGSAFGGWSGSGCSGTGTCTVTMSEVREVEAEFK